MEKTTIAARQLRSYIWEGMEKKVYPDRVELYLPFYFGSKAAPLCLTWFEDGRLSDGGRTMTELKKRLGDITPYMGSIQKILSHRGIADCRLTGGQILQLTYLQDPLRALNMMLQVISPISAVDRITVVD